MKVKKSKYRIKVKKEPVVIAESIGIISHKYGASSLDPDFPTCDEPGCGTKATCNITVNGHLRRVCVRHWCVYDRKRAGMFDLLGTSVVRTPGIKKGAITNAVIALLESKGKGKVPTCSEMKKVVLDIKANSKFNKNHYNWYLNQWKKGKLRRKR